jgi:hypothetical protein
VAILELIHARNVPDSRRGAFIRSKSIRVKPVPVMTLDNFVPTAWPCAGGAIFQMSALSTFDGR